MQPDVSYLDEYNLLRDFKSGSMGALEKIYAVQYKPLWYFANRLLDDEMHAEDVVAETFVKLWQRRQQFETLKGIYAFIFTVARNACFDHLKHVSRKKSSLKELTYLTKLDQDFCNTQMLRTELVSLALAEGDLMPPQMKRIFKLLYIEGFNLSEVAEETGLSINTVKAQKVKALKRVRGALVRKDLLLLLIFLLLFLIDIFK